MKALAILCCALVLAVACSSTPEPSPTPTPTKPVPSDRARFSGRVADQTGLPLASVCISGGKTGDCSWLSDVEGKFVIGDIPPGEWTFFFEKPGYLTSQIPLLLDAGKLTERDVTLAR